MVRSAKCYEVSVWVIEKRKCSRSNRELGVFRLEETRRENLAGAIALCIGEASPRHARLFSALLVAK